MFKHYLTLSAIAAASAQQMKLNDLDSNDTSKDTKSDHWAFIVAGSNKFSNYRHQADTCHAYQIMKKNGIPED